MTLLYCFLACIFICYVLLGLNIALKLVEIDEAYGVALFLSIPLFAPIYLVILFGYVLGMRIKHYNER